MKQVHHVRVAEDDTGIRLDRWFRRHFPDLGHARLEKLLRTGQVRVDGSRVRASVRIETGQTIRVPPPVEDKRKGAGRPTQEDCDWMRSLVIHSDRDLIALNKPQGVAVQGGRKVTRHLDGLLGALAEPGDGPLRLVHRLDRDTSGILLVARRASVASSLAEAFRDRRAEKTYWALVAGVPEPRMGTIDLPLLKKAGHDGNEKVVVDHRAGRQAVTEYEVAGAAGRKVSWLVLKPSTGRTHQVRVHCAALGTPIVGDRKYGGEPLPEEVPGAGFLHLHARSIALPHPGGGILRVAAPLPEAIADAWHFFGFDTEKR